VRGFSAMESFAADGRLKEADAETRGELHLFAISFPRFRVRLERKPARTAADDFRTLGLSHFRTLFSARMAPEDGTCLAKPVFR
jgi:hypothetical protein